MSKLKKNYFITQDKEKILFYVEYNSKTLYNILSNTFDHNYTLYRKYLTHSDLVTRGKLTRSKKTSNSKEDYVKSCMLYYQSATELLKYDKLPVAAQSNIVLPDDFYKETRIKSYEQNGKKQYDIVAGKNINFFIPFDTLKDFNLEDLNKICEKNNKNKYSAYFQKKLKSFNIVNYKEGDNLLKPDALHIAAHGLGTRDDKLFDYLRSFVFKGDVLNLLFDETNKILYLFFERNEKYYSILNDDKSDTAFLPIWEGYDSETKANIVKTLYCTSEINGSPDAAECLLKSEEISAILANYYAEYNLTLENIVNSGKVPKYRWFQNKWRETLIKIDEIQYSVKGYAVCAVSKTQGEYSRLGKFFIASHIKPYADCIKEGDYESAFDPYNGLMLCANIDALFDKFLISITEEGKIIASDAAKTITGYGKFAFDGNSLDEYYLTEKRKEYFKLHKQEYDRRNNTK